MSPGSTIHRAVRSRHALPPGCRENPPYRRGLQRSGGYRHANLFHEPVSEATQCLVILLVLAVGQMVVRLFEDDLLLDRPDLSVLVEEGQPQLDPLVEVASRIAEAAPSVHPVG